MKHVCAAVVLAALVAAPTVARADGMEGNVEFTIGERYLEDFWKPLDRQSSFGVQVDFAPSKSPVHVALGLHVAGEQQTVNTPFFGDTGKVTAGFLEFSAGFVWLPVRKAVVRPYVGAGVLKMYSGAGSSWSDFSSSDGDDSFGFYGSLGMFFKVGEHFNIGLDGRIVRGTSLTIKGVEGNGDYTQAAMLIGFSWGGPSQEPSERVDPDVRPPGNDEVPR